MILQFGKFKGQSLDSLKRTADGVSYLEWGSAKLRDTKARQAFADALASMTDHDHAVIIAAEDCIGYDEALTHVRNMRAMEAEDAAEFAAEEARKDAIFARWSSESGQPVAKLKAVSERYFMDWREYPASHFSSPAAYQLFRKYMNEIWK